jgi:hypothetical protein
MKRKKKKTSKTASNQSIDLQRRNLLQLLGLGLGSSSLLGLGGISSLVPSLYSAEASAATTEPHRILQIFLEGGWDSQFAIDPVLAGSSKALSGNFQPSYYDGTINNSRTQVPGKSNLFVGAGLYGSKDTFASIPTAFINGVFVEVTAHELAVNYMLSGQLTLSRSREYPAFIATLADKMGGFPAHVVLGGNIPLADTRDTHPPLQSSNMDTFSGMLAGPRAPGFVNLSEASIAAADQLITTLNGSFQSKLAGNAEKGLLAWRNAELGLGSLYQKRYDQSIVLTDPIKTSYGITNSDSMQAKLAGAYLILKEGLTPYVTVAFNGFDTHSSHTSTHLPRQQEFSTALNQLVADLKATDDPEAPGKKLSETTTIIISSEFVRTPKYNLSGGTDHWQSGSLIMMGKGIKDNVSIGATDDEGKVMGWKNGAPQALTATNVLLPEHIAASVLRRLGLTTEADGISPVHLSELFDV